MSFPPIQRLLRRVPALRWCAMQYALKQRAKRADVRWAYRQSILVMVGNVTIMWAGVERILDELIAHWQHSATDLTKAHPRGLSKKLEYLKDMQRDPRISEPVREFLRYTRIEAKRLGNERHEIIHGLLNQQGTTTNWRTQRVIYEGAICPPNASEVQQRRAATDQSRNL